MNKLKISLYRSEALSSLVNYCESVKFRGLEYPIKYWQMCSFDETKALQVNNSHTGSGCGEVGRAVASSTRDPRFESSHRQIYLLSIVVKLY